MNNFLDTVTQGDCIDTMKLLPSNSVDLILTDPPYFKVVKNSWDNQWKKADEFLSWLDLVAEQWERVLKPTGSIYCFASSKMSSRIENKLTERFNILNNIRWDKTQQSGGNLHKIISKDTLKSYIPAYESILFAEHYNSDKSAKGIPGYSQGYAVNEGFVFERLRRYLDSERIEAELSFGEINRMCGNHMATHWFTYNKWVLPTESNYMKLQKNTKYFRKCYKVLVEEYNLCNLLYQSKKRTFNSPTNTPFTSTWNYDNAPKYKGSHCCEKPSQMLKDIIQTSSNRGDVILDCFSGGGSTLINSKKLGRHFIGVDLDPYWVKYSIDRLLDNP